MESLFRSAWLGTWRSVVSLVGFYLGVFAGEGVQWLRGKSDYYTPSAWAFSIALCFFTFCLLAIGLAGWAALDRRGRRLAAVMQVGLVYTVAALWWCGAWTGAVDRPYRLVFIIGCGWMGLALPWAVEIISDRLAQRRAQAESIVQS